MVRVRAEGFNLEVTGTHSGAKRDPWGEKRRSESMWHNKFTITVKNMENGKSVNFPFYDSNRNYHEGKTKLSEDDLLSAFVMIVGEATYGGMTLQDLCDEFGYDCSEDTEEVRRVKKGLDSSRDKLNQIGISDSDMFELVNSPDLEEYR